MSETKQRVSNEIVESNIGFIQQAKDIHKLYKDPLIDMCKDLLDARKEIETLQKELASGIIVQAAHLLEQLEGARKERDEARAMIREMRDAFSYIDCLDINPSTTTLSTIQRLRLAVTRARKMLLKSKEYAE